MSVKKNQFGLTDKELDVITSVLKTFPEVEKAAIFGSRALGTYKRGSDIDIALYGQIPDEILTQISYQLNEETLLPYQFDVTVYNNIDNVDFKDHIDRVAIAIYKYP